VIVGLGVAFSSRDSYQIHAIRLWLSRQDVLKRLLIPGHKNSLQVMA